MYLSYNEYKQISQLWFSSKQDLPFEDIKNTDVTLRKRKLIDEFECSEISTTSKRLRPSVDLSMTFGSPKLDIANTSLSAPVSQRKTTLFDYGFCKKNVPKLRRSFSTSEDTIKAAFEKGEYIFIVWMLPSKKW